jgi:Leucine-rich repeat (LRR) protein
VFEDIDLSGNMLTSLQWAGVLWGVQTLALDNNRLAGLGFEIGSLPNLRTLSLRCNGMIWCHKDCSIR